MTYAFLITLIVELLLVVFGLAAQNKDLRKANDFYRDCLYGQPPTAGGES